MGALPKRRLTRSRRHARRGQLRIAGPILGRCPNCRSLVPAHRVCPVCGTYRGKPVVETTERATKYR